MRIYTSANDPLDFCKRHFPSEAAAELRYGNLGAGPDRRGNCFAWMGCRASRLRQSHQVHVREMRLSSHALRQLMLAPQGRLPLVIADTAAMREARRLPPALRWVPLDTIAPGDAGGPTDARSPCGKGISKHRLIKHRISRPGL